MTIRVVDSIVDGVLDLPCEDVIGWVGQAYDGLALWAIDGASTLSESPFNVFSDQTDSGWFANALSDALCRRLRDNAFAPEMMALVLRQLRSEYLALAPGTPDWQFPVAACTIVELELLGNRVIATIHDYADCFAYFLEGDSGQNSKNLSQRGHRVPAGQPWQACSGFGGNVLADLRIRRAQQQLNQNTTALTLNPASAANARRTQSVFDMPLQILIGTDGLARLWEIYGVLTAAQACEQMATGGLGSLFDALRRFESERASAGPRRKKADDAAGIYIECRIRPDAAIVPQRQDPT